MTKSTRIICILSPVLSSLICYMLLIVEIDGIVPWRVAFWIGSVMLVSYCALLVRSFMKFFQANGWWWFNIVQGVIIVAFNLVLIGMSISILKDLFRGWTDALLP